jgi:hypothetical protein
LESLDLAVEFSAKVSALETPYTSLDSRAKYAPMHDMQDYYKRLFELEHPGEPFAGTQGGGDTVMDDDIEVTGSIVSLKCPITVMLLFFKYLLLTISHYGKSACSLWNQSSRSSALMSFPKLPLWSF